MNIFESASRKKYRYQSAKGDLTTEQLWDLPLSTGPANLDLIARAVNAELKSVSEESFVVVRPDPRKDELAEKLEVLKHVIAVKMADAEKAKQAVERAEKRRKLVDAIASQEERSLANMSKEDLLKQLAELDA